MDRPATAYKILTADQWAALDRDGHFAGAPVDLADGYIHLSAADQVAETAARHFAGQAGLVLAAVDLPRYGDLVRWEPSRGGALFPHLYGLLTRDRVLWADALEEGLRRARAGQPSPQGNRAIGQAPPPMARPPSPSAAPSSG